MTEWKKGTWDNFIDDLKQDALTKQYLQNPVPPVSSYFGKGCRHLIGQWENVFGNPNYMDSPPVICFCNHPGNRCDTEGNCIEGLCPKEMLS